MDYLNATGNYYFPPRPWDDLSLKAVFQDPWELATLSYWVKCTGIETYLEIGVAGGGLMHYLINHLNLKAYGIDIVDPIFDLNSEFCIGNCHSVEAIKWAEQNAPYDMVFIDADHSYEAVKIDWELYGSMATKMVVFHDIAHETLSGPKKVWDSIEGRKLEIISSGKGLGIGILFKE